MMLVSHEWFRGPDKNILCIALVIFSLIVYGSGYKIKFFIDVYIFKSS